MGFKEKMENPMTASLAMIVLVSGGLTAIGTITGVYDDSHTSAAELKVVSDKMEETDLKATCSTLSIQISLAEQSIWQMNQAEDHSQRLIELQRALRNMLLHFDDLHCSSVLQR